MRGGELNKKPVVFTGLVELTRYNTIKQIITTIKRPHPEALALIKINTVPGGEYASGQKSWKF